jgi:hypothetical protein
LYQWEVALLVVFVVVVDATGGRWTETRLAAGSARRTRCPAQANGEENVEKHKNNNEYI